MLKISEKSSSYLVPFKLFTLTFNNFADTFIQSDLQMRVIEAIKTTKEQQYVCCDMSRLV